MSAVSSDALGTDPRPRAGGVPGRGLPRPRIVPPAASGIDRYEGRRENVVPAVAAGITTRK